MVLIFLSQRICLVLRLISIRYCQRTLIVNVVQLLFNRQQECKVFLLNCYILTILFVHCAMCIDHNFGFLLPLLVNKDQYVNKESNS